MRSLSCRRRSRRAPAGPRRRYPARNRARCRRRRTDKPETAGSRRLWPFPFGEAGKPPRAIRTEHLLGAFDIRGFAAAGGFARRKRVAVDELQHLGSIENFTFEQRLGDLDERFGMFVDDGGGGVVAALHQLLALLVDADGGLFAVIAVLGNLAPEEDLLFLLAETEWPQLAHAPFAYHLAGDR